MQSHPKRTAQRFGIVSLASLVLSACMASGPDGEADVATSEAALVGGIDTNARPEIGSMLFTKGGTTWGCTATLIGPRYALTAGHCSNYSTTFTSSSLKLPNQATAYGVSAIHTFGAYRPALYAIPDGPDRFDDVELLQLSTAVPTSVASPAMIAIVPPNASNPPYGTQTIFGYGCKNRSPESGGGNKQYVSFTYGNTTQALCSGDSGGPVVSGSVNGNGAVWGVNSSYDTATGIDSFGSASYYKEEMQSVIRKWEGGVIELGVYRVGVDYGTTTVSDWSICMNKCRDDAKCRGFSWRTSTQQCDLKSAISDWRFDPDYTSYSGVQLEQDVFMTRTNVFPGTDYSTISSSFPDHCLAACARDAKCKAYSMNASNQICYLKSGSTTRTVDYVSVSGVKRALEQNTDRPGVDYSHVAAKDAATCQQTCSTDHRCRTFTWVQSSKLCYLHSTQTQPVSRTNAVSGVKRGLEVNTDRPGFDYKDYDQAFSNTPESCQADCATDANCQAFTFAPAGRIRTAAHCWLKNGIPASTEYEGLVSGMRGLDFY